MIMGKTKRRIKNLQRFRKIINVLVKHGFGFLVNKLNLSHYLPIGKRVFEKKFPDESLPIKMRLVLEELGPTFIKFGQMLSTRPDLIPEDYLNEFKKLQDEVPAFEFKEVEKQVQTELGNPIGKLFQDFSITPKAAASIAQVHLACLANGESIAVKIQRPGISKIIETDLNILFYLANLIEKHIPESELYQPVNLINEFAKSIRRELDFTTEARNIDKFSRNFSEVESVYIPKVYWKYTTKKILTMERIEGIKITDMEKLESAGLDRKKVAINGANAVLKQIFIDGLFHGDPHPGNIYVLDNNVIAFLDFGIVGKLDEERRELITDLLIATFQMDSDKIITLFSTLELINENIEIKDLKQEIDDIIDQYYDLSLEQLETGKLIQEIFQVIHKYKIRIPSDFILLGKALVTIEGVGKELDPEFNLSIQIKPFAKELIKRKHSFLHFLRDINKVSSELGSLIRVLPGEIRQIVKKIQTGKIKIEFEHRGLEDLIHTMDRVSNRIAFSIIAAALIIGSSLIIQTDKYQVLGISGFIIAGVLGIWLIASILHSGKI